MTKKMTAKGFITAIKRFDESDEQIERWTQRFERCDTEKLEAVMQVLIQQIDEAYEAGDTRSEGRIEALLDLASDVRNNRDPAFYVEHLPHRVEIEDLSLDM